MLGAIIGDIVGSRFEFNNIKTKKFNLFDKKCKVTDDSVMSVAVAEMCLNGYVPNNPQMIIQTFKKWGHKYPNAGYGNRFSNWLFSNESMPYNSCGNGSAMRISPIGFFANSKEEVSEFSKAVTQVTHNHIEGIKGAYVTAMCIYLARKGASKQEIKMFVEKHYDINFNYEHLRKTYKHDAEICQNTVPQAIYCFLISNGFEDCLRTTISIGGDCDTTASISCAIAEAYYGIPSQIIEQAMEYISDDMLKIIKRFDFETNISSVTRYGKILKFIKPLKEYPKKLIRWTTPKREKNNEDVAVLNLPFPIYESDVIEFFRSMNPFVVDDYKTIIESYGIKYENLDIYNLDLSKYDDKLVLAIISAILSYKRIHDTLIFDMIENGIMLKLLLRLKDFDEPLLKEDIITKITYSFSCFGDFYKNESFVIDIISSNKVRIEYSAIKIDRSIKPVLILNEADSKTLITKLKNLNILEWKDKYEPEDVCVCDGESWDMNIDTYNLGHIYKEGCNAFPENWHSFRNFRRWILSKLKNEK